MTEQLEKPPPPSRSSIPVASESEDLADDITMEEVVFDEFEEWESPPPLPSSPTGPKVKFFPYDDPPVPIRGYAAIQSNVIYPETAREAGIDGTVIVQAFINKKGVVLETVILSGVPYTGLDEAAAEAVRNTQFKPELAVKYINRHFHEKSEVIPGFHLVRIDVPSLFMNSSVYSLNVRNKYGVEILLIRKKLGGRFKDTIPTPFTKMIQGDQILIFGREENVKEVCKLI